MAYAVVVMSAAVFCSASGEAGASTAAGLTNFHRLLFVTAMRHVAPETSSRSWSRDTKMAR